MAHVRGSAKSAQVHANHITARLSRRTAGERACRSSFSLVCSRSMSMSISRSLKSMRNQNLRRRRHRAITSCLHGLEVQLHCDLQSRQCRRRTLTAPVTGPSLCLAMLVKRLMSHRRTARRASNNSIRRPSATCARFLDRFQGERLLCTHTTTTMMSSVESPASFWTKSSARADLESSHAAPRHSLTSQRARWQKTRSDPGPMDQWCKGRTK